MSRVPSRGSDQFPLRMPDGMREAIRGAADANGRSMNSEILARLDAGAETLRDRFAMAALTAYLMRPDADSEPYAATASWAFDMADAMLAERSGS